MLGRVLADGRRALLADLLRTHSNAELGKQSGRDSLLEGIRDTEHAHRLATCFAFEDVRRCSLKAAQSISNAIQGAVQEVGQLARRRDVLDAFDELGRKCDALKASVAPDAPKEALTFSEEQAGSSDLAMRIASLAGRAPMIFSVIGKCIDKGVAYTGKPLVADDAYDAQEIEEASVLDVPTPLLRFRRLLKDAEMLK